MNSRGEGSSLNLRPTRAIPRRSRARTPPQHRGHPGEIIPPPRGPPQVMGLPGQSAFTPYASPQQPLQMGVPGQTAFIPYASPPPPPSGSGSNIGGAQAVSVGGGVPALRIGGSPAVGNVAGGAAGGDQPVNENQVRCTVCGRVFRTPKALFGHMRSHPDRGWRGAHPPPAFRAEEEFADIHGGEEAVAAEGGGGGGEGMQEEVEVEEHGLPDLNMQPPPHSN